MTKQSTAGLYFQFGQLNFVMLRDFSDQHHLNEQI